MPRPPALLAIDARPRGPHGPLAFEIVQGQCVLEHLLDLALPLNDAPIVIHARLEEHRLLRTLIADRPSIRVTFATGPPSEGSAILRTDRLYDSARLRRVLRRGRDPESAVVWRLDHPHGLAGAEAELKRRQSYQPLGRYWAYLPALALARGLSGTRVRPNVLTSASAALVLGAAAAVAFAPADLRAHGAAAAALALGLMLDTADGLLARLQGTASEFGRWLDATLDELGDMSLHAAAAWAAFLRDGWPAWLLLGMVYGMGKYVFMIAIAPGNHAADQTRNSGHNVPAQTGFSFRRRVVDAARLAGHADVRWHLWIVLAAFGRMDVALAAYAFYYPARSIAAAARKAARHA